jgi:hypothetical protein
MTSQPPMANATGATGVDETDQHDGGDVDVAFFSTRRPDVHVDVRGAPCWVQRTRQRLRKFAYPFIRPENSHGRSSHLHAPPCIIVP